MQPFAKIATPPTEEFKDYQLPGFELLHYEEKPDGPTDADREEMLEIQQKIIETLTTFRVDVTPGDITRGPTITRYEVYPARGVRVNSISPGWIDTGKFGSLTREDALQHPAGRAGVPADVVKGVFFLCLSGFVNAENLVIDGGMTRMMVYHGEEGWTYNPCLLYTSPSPRD